MPIVSADLLLDKSRAVKSDDTSLTRFLSVSWKENDYLSVKSIYSLALVEIVVKTNLRRLATSK